MIIASIRRAASAIRLARTIYAANRDVGLVRSAIWTVACCASLAALRAGPLRRFR